MKPVLLDITSPFVYLPMDDDSGAVANDKGTGVDFTLIDGGGNAWSETNWLTGSNASNNCIWSDAPAVYDIFDIFKGANEGVGGKATFMSFNLKGTYSGALMAFGSTTASSSGWQIQYSGNNLLFVDNPEGASSGNNKRLTSVGGMPGSGEHHVCLLFDFANGDHRAWVDGVPSLQGIADRTTLLSIATAAQGGNDGLVGPTIMSRNTATTSNGPHTPSNSWNAQINHLLVVDLSNVVNPWTYADKNVKNLSNLGGRPPKNLVNW